jgi:hypothetical protein
VESPIVAAADLARLLGRDPAEWRAVRLAEGSHRGGGGVWRLTGADWSLVLKAVVRHARADRGGPMVDDPAHFFYWRREPIAYASGLLDDLPGVRAPRCHRVEERADGSYWLWLEDLVDDFGAAWPLPRYAAAARHLGRFGGAFLHGRSVPAQPWLGPGYRRVWSGESVDPLASFRRTETWDDPRARAALPEAAVGRVLAAWDDRRALEDRADAGSTTLCHHDAFRRNMVAVGGGTVLLDWEYLGPGPLGGDAAHLTTTSLLMGNVPGAEAGALDAAVFDGYLAGLDDAGWRGDARLLRRAYCAFGARRWLPTAARRAVAAATCEDPAERARLEAWLGMPIERCARQWADLTDLLLRFVDEARV